MASFDRIPAQAKVQPTQFTVAIPDEKLDEMRQLLKLAKVAPETFEASQGPETYGVTREWLLNAKSELEKYDWKQTEQHINSFPNFKHSIKHGSDTLDIHFAALFSQKADAIPVTFLHGWPGSFMEFLPILDKLRTKYTADTLPYHVIVPSHPGYAFSSTVPLEREYGITHTADIFHQLMLDLGFANGYVVQGGDIGSRVARIMGKRYPDIVKGVHLNFCFMLEPEQCKGMELNQREQDGLVRWNAFRERGSAYAFEHSSRPSTIGFVLQASPLSLLAWVGEKFLTWVDKPLPLSTILDDIALYWLTETIAKSLYAYRTDYAFKQIGGHGNPDYKLPNFGYSSFPKELANIPKAWVETSGNLTFYKEHDQGGHFAALEQPELLLQDFTEYVHQVWEL
ncbi:alpha/beta-hydrolase [Pseudovirgaria hyperparasitica]|uniref:Alpha/beta-hydrolase n=1 Tax=Pseudovirgaria hyperparasitica TaxID=470096 RepID=A0A6A6W3D1_9PEZI|nr:alpha/beta-hydrolase [Pseudovirgaria hyperparasitica]KAF2756486.1 alpha/beta-hydrolase [Pseudovirgaria hyperparasitica]